jgi:hypothetical protein
MQNQQELRVTADDPNTYDHREIITSSRKAVGKIQQKYKLMKHMLNIKHQFRSAMHTGYWELLI